MHKGIILISGILQKQWVFFSLYQFVSNSVDAFVYIPVESNPNESRLIIHMYLCLCLTFNRCICLCAEYTFVCKCQPKITKYRNIRMKNKEEICNWNILMVQLIVVIQHILCHIHMQIGLRLASTTTTTMTTTSDCHSLQLFNPYLMHHMKLLIVSRDAIECLHQTNMLCKSSIPSQCHACKNVERTTDNG